MNYRLLPKTSVRQLAVALLLASGCSLIVRPAEAKVCTPRWSGTWTVTESCDWVGSAKIYGDIVVGAYTITLKSGSVMSFDTSTNKMTFAGGMVWVESGARMDHSVANRYQLNISYSSGVFTSCPAGMQVLNVAQSAFLTSFASVAQTGTFTCAYP